MEKCRRMRRLQCMSKELDIFLTMKVIENTPAVLSLGELCDENGYSYEWINGQKPHIIKNGIRIQCNTENFVPMVSPGLSTSSSSRSHHSTSMAPWRQERHCSTSSSSSSSSPTTTSSDSETREREDRTESDTSPVPVSSFNVDDRTGHPLFAVNPITSKVAKPTKNTKKTNKEGDHDRTGTPVVCRLRSRKFWNPGVAARIQIISSGW